MPASRLSICNQQLAIEVARKTKRNLSTVTAWISKHIGDINFQEKLEKYMDEVHISKVRTIEHYISMIMKRTNRPLEEVTQWVEENKDKPDFKTLLSNYIRVVVQPEYMKEVQRVMEITGKSEPVVKNWVRSNQNKPNYEERLYNYIHGITGHKNRMPVESTIEAQEIAELSGKKEGSVRSWYMSHRGKENYLELRAEYIASGPDLYKPAQSKFRYRKSVE